MEIQRASGSDMTVSAVLPSASPRVEQIDTENEQEPSERPRIVEQSKGQNFDSYA